MKIKHIWSVLCKESVINQDDNLISIHGVLEELNVSLMPMNSLSNKLPNKISIPMNYEVVSFWFKDKKTESVKAEVEYKLIDPENKELVKTIQNIEIPESIRRFRSRMKISGMPVTKEGDYVLRVSIKEQNSKKFETISELPLEIKIKVENSSRVI